MRSHSRNIIAIESWENFDMEPRQGMKHLLDFLTLTNQIRYHYSFVNTPSELEYILKTIPTKKYSLLYLALHGNPEKINIGAYTEFQIKLDELADMMGRRFEGFGLHLASCAVMNGWEETIFSFKHKTGLAFISGFTKYVDFNESAVVDHILINEWVYSRSYRKMFERMTTTHKKMLQNNGFEFLI